jgi:para-nitrobenzyl esterase
MTCFTPAWLRHAAFAVVAMATPLAASAQAPGDPIVKTTDGVLKGATADGISSFKGIPYAAPPVGALRWRPPQPKAAWKGVRDATKVGAICEQVYNAQDNGVGPLPMSEDCLTLNVWTPDVAAKTGKKPVMVWIHGGGHVNGSGTAALYDGTNLAKQGVVVVTLNYRLGRLGFFAHPALDREHPNELKANYGLMDTLAAMKWVKANAARFGGDPNNITIFGESAGGISVNYLMTMPAAKGLYAKAIMESGAGREHGAALKGEPRFGIPSAEATGEAFARANGVTDEKTAAAALRALPADVLMKDSPSSGNGGGPMIDGKLVTEDPEQAFAKGRQAKVPFLIGTNGLEFPVQPGANKAYDAPIAPVLAKRDEAIAAYGDETAFKDHVVSDVLFTEPAHYLAVEQAKTGAPVYLYRFTFMSDAIKGRLKGAVHASERQYVFDTLGASPWPVGKQDPMIAAQMSRYWTNFARTGDPNGDGLPRWESFGKQPGQLLDFGPAGAAFVPIPDIKVIDFIAGLNR